MKQDQLNCILEKHAKWRRGEKDGERANLSGANLSGADLIGADLICAYLSGANLSGANLSGADLSGANLIGADLICAYLSGANLSGANLSGANLSGAYLSGAYLSGANLSGANLSGANLICAYLSGANLSGAKNIAELQQSRLSIVPETGSFEGWKKCRGGVIVRLLIPESSARSSATGRKCRAECATVLEVIGADEGISQHDPSVRYVKGETVKADKWESDRWQECAGGIHFFITRAEAEDY